MKLRKGSFDEVIKDEIENRLVYPLPPSFEDMVVVDIGAHIGLFSDKAANMGAKAVYAFEAHPENFSYLNMNMEEHEQVRVFNRAVWRSDEEVDLSLSTEGFEENSGICHISSDGDYNLRSIGLDQIFEIIKSDGYDKIDYLKIDCEGCEFPILYTCSCMGSVGTIAAEIHLSAKDRIDFGKLSYEASSQGIKDFLLEQGYEDNSILLTNFCWATPLDMLYAIR